MDPAEAFVLNVHQWPIGRRIAMTGLNNLNSCCRRRPGHSGPHGRYTNRRRWRLEKPLNHAMRMLAPMNLHNLHRKIEWLPPSARDLARDLFKRLGDFFPGRWALQTWRSSDRKPAWYVPRRSWAICAAWLRLWRAFERRVFLGAALISRPMPTLSKRGRIQGLGQDEVTSFERRKGSELARFRAWRASQATEDQPMT